MKMLIESGVLPMGAVLQLEKWKVLEEGTAAQAGTRPVSLDGDSEAARKFTTDLREALDEENSTIREMALDTHLTSVTAREVVWHQSEGAGSTLALSNVEIHMDKLGRVHMAAEAGDLAGVVIGEKSYLVVDVEHHYIGEKLDSNIYTLKEFEG
jgi:hypothetical protein